MPREWIFMECGECAERWYRTDRNKRQGAKTKLELSKFCRRCRKHTKHVERKK